MLTFEERIHEATREHLKGEIDRLSMEELMSLLSAVELIKRFGAELVEKLSGLSSAIEIIKKAHEPEPSTDTATKDSAPNRRKIRRITPSEKERVRLAMYGLQPRTPTYRFEREVLCQQLNLTIRQIDYCLENKKNRVIPFASAM